MKKNKEDKSIHVPQRDKIKGLLNIRALPWTETQKSFLDLAFDKKSRIIFVSGPAGSTKTILATYVGLELISQHKVSDLLYIRSAVESGDSKMGYLPGELEDKMFFYGIPCMEKMEELLTKQDITFLQKEKRIQIFPVNYVRGQSWNARAIIVDEAQNFTQKELITTLTRVGKFSKCFVLADPNQSDINGKSGAFSQMVDFFSAPERAERAKGAGVHVFKLGKQDIMRDDLTRFLVEEFEKLPPVVKAH